jgi:TolB protein
MQTIRVDGKWRRRLGIAAIGAGIAGLAIAVTAQGQQRQPFELEVRGQGFQRITIQIPEPSMDGGAQSARKDVDEAQETLARDLIYSGFFYVMDQYASPFLPRGVSRAWNVSNERPEQRPHKVTATWTGSGGTLAAELRLLDGAGNQVLGKRYQVGQDGGRQAMHHFADQVVTQLTGLPGTAQTKIAYARLGNKAGEIEVVDYDGFGERALTAQKTLTLSPCWGGGRSWLAFTSYVERSPFLYRLDQGTRRLRAISRQPGLNTTPDWCEKRKSFALTLTRDGNAEIYAMDQDGKGLKRLTHNPGIDTSPSWSAVGDQIAFTSDRSGVPQIYAMDADGGHVRRLTQHGLYSDSPAWSPDGRWIAYVCRREGDSQLVVMSPSGSDERVVVREGSSDSPSWANDSRHIAFSSRRGGARANLCRRSLFGSGTSLDLGVPGSRHPGVVERIRIGTPERSGAAAFFMFQEVTIHVEEGCSLDRDRRRRAAGGMLEEDDGHTHHR